MKVSMLCRRWILSAAVVLSAGLSGAEPAAKNVRKIRLIQDDAQDYMVSKIY